MTERGSERFDLLIRGGRVVSGDMVLEADVGISDGVIDAIGHLDSTGAAREVDARGFWVFPGGVDPHTHVRWPFLNATSHDDFASASRAALHGGTTTIVDWALPAEGSALMGAGRRVEEALADGVMVDFGLHSVLGPNMDRRYDEIPELIERGLPTFKCYLTYRKRGLLTEDAGLAAALRVAAPLGGIVGVHAENPSIHERAEAEFRAAGLGEPRHFRLAKDNLVEASAVNKAIYLAEQLGGILMIQHISTREAVEQVRNARHRRVLVYAETCPHYLTLTDEVYERPDGHRFICSPPIKSEADRAALWDGLTEGTISMVGADHCAFTSADKAMGESAFDVPNGLPGIETRLPLLYHFGVAEKRLDPTRFAAVVAGNAARVAGLFPRKGVIAVSSDADLVLIDPNRLGTVSSTTLHQAADWTPYEGMRLRGFPPIATVLRGEVVVEDGKFTAPTTPGRFLPGRPHGHMSVR